MKRLGAIKSVRRVASAAINSPNQDFLREVIDLIENEVDVDEDGFKSAPTYRVPSYGS